MSDSILSRTAPSVLCQSLLQSGIRVFLQSGLLLLAGLCVGRAVRRSGPARQQHIYEATLSAVALCALVSLGLTGHLPALYELTLPSAVVAAPSAAEHGAKPASPAPASSQPTTQSGADAGAAASGELRDTGGHVVSVQVVPGPVTAAGDYQSSTAPFTQFLRPASAGEISSPGRVYIAAMLVWCAVSVCLLGWLALCYAGIHRICRRARPVQDQELSDQLAALCAAQGLRAPRLLVSADVESVFLAGIVRPAILLPAAYAACFDGETLRAILAHEVAHLRARDGAWTLITRLLCALLWMQPLLCRIGRLREQASEEVCDQAVVAQGCSPRAYADCLVMLAERLIPNRWERAVGSGSIVFRSSLAQRVEKLIGGGWEQSLPVTRRFRIAVGLCNALFALSLALAVSAAPLQATDSMNGDRRLDQRVTISAEGVPIGELLDLVSHKTGVSLSATPDVADDKIIIFGPPRRLREIMADMAALFNTVWVPIETQGGPLRYSLVSTPRAKQYEADLADATTRRILARLEEQVRALNETPAQFARRAPNDPIRLALSAPDGRAATGVFSMLTPEQRRELIERNFFRFPVSALTEAQKDEIKVMYHGKRLDDLNAMVAKQFQGAVIPNAAVSRQQMDQEEVTFTVSQAGGAAGQGADLSITMSASTGLSMDLTHIHTDVGFLMPAHGNPYTGQPVPQNAPLPPVKDMADLEGGTWPDQLKSLAAKTGRPVVADYYRTRPIFAAGSDERAAESPAMTALDAICRPQGYLWWNRGRTLLLRKRDWYTQRLYEAPDRWVSGLIAHLKAEKGVLSIGDLLSLHELTTNQIAGLNAHGHPLRPAGHVGPTRTAGGGRRHPRRPDPSIV